MDSDEFDRLHEAARYISCTGCKHVRLYWRKSVAAPIWKCQHKTAAGAGNCPRPGNRCDQFTQKERLNDRTKAPND